MQVVQAALPGMRAQGWGRIVYVTTLTTLGTPERTPYAAAKAALETCTRIWANELASTGITVNAVAPGPTETEMYRQRSPVGQSAKLGFCRAFRCKGSVPRLKSPTRSVSSLTTTPDTSPVKSSGSTVAEASPGERVTRQSRLLSARARRVGSVVAMLPDWSGQPANVQLREVMQMSESRPPLPPFDLESAIQKTQAAEDAWNTRNPELVAASYTADSHWRNRDEHIIGHDQIVEFLTRKWQRELDYALRKSLWAFRDNRIAVRFQYEWHDTEGQWYRSYGNELWEFAPSGLMSRREASINDIAIDESERRYFGPRPKSEHGSDIPLW